MIPSTAQFVIGNKVRPSAYSNYDSYVGPSSTNKLTVNSFRPDQISESMMVDPDDSMPFDMQRNAADTLSPN